MGIFRLRLKLRRPVDVGFTLSRVFILEVEASDLQVRLELIVDGVLLLPGLQRDADQHLGGPTPVLLALVDVCKVLTDRPDLMRWVDGGNAVSLAVQKLFRCQTGFCPLASS